MIFQSPEATAAAIRATEDAQKRLKANRVARPTPQEQINVDKLLSILRPMVNRYKREGYRGSIDQWNRLERELTRD